MITMTREQKLAAVWRNTHCDFKGTYEGVRTIMVCRRDLGTCLVALDDLSDKEIDDRLPKAKAA
jgi:hypothetical protein